MSKNVSASRGLAAVAVAITVSGVAHAELIGLHAESIASNTLTNTTLVGMTYRISLQFDNPADGFISALDGDIDFLTPVFQHPSGTVFGPHDPALDSTITNLAADSYIAINEGLPASGPDWNTDLFENGLGIQGDWFMGSAPTDPESFPDANGRVLVMFLTFAGEGHPEVNGLIGTTNASGVINSWMLGDLMQGSILFSYNPDSSAAGAIIGVTVNFLPVPAPGAVALFGVAGILGKRRRRRA